MSYKDWTAFLQSKDSNKLELARKLPKLLLMKFYESIDHFKILKTKHKSYLILLKKQINRF